MFKKKSSVVLFYMVGVTMVGAVTFASIPGNMSAVPAIVSSGQSPASKKLQIIQTGSSSVGFDTVPVGDLQSAVPETARAPAPSTQTAAYSPATGLIANPVLTPASVTPVSSVLTPAALVDNLTDDCRLDSYNRKAAPPVEKLVAVIAEDINRSGPNPSTDSIRMRVQADLNRVGGFPDVKAQAIQRLQVVYRNDSQPSLALAKPFDLNDDGMVYANGYDPCGNPAATGGASAFGTGPFSNVFTTINPVPVVAARSTATTEGGPAV